MTFQGYVSRCSVEAGEPIDFKLSGVEGDRTPVVHRLGEDDNLVASDLVIQVTHQPPPPENGWEGFGWDTTWTLSTGAGWGSGYYRAYFLENAGGTVTNAPFVDFLIRARPADVLALGLNKPPLLHVPTATVQAYSDSGGKCLYDDTSGGSIESRAHRVSFDRPVINSGAARMDVSVKLIRFMKDEDELGGAPHCCSSYDLHARKELLDSYDLLLLAGHDEYWSKEMRDHVEAFVRSGGNLVVLSGNTCYRQVRFEDAGRSLVCYKSAALDVNAPSASQVTVAWDLPPVNRPSNHMIGAGFSLGAIRNQQDNDEESKRILFDVHYPYHKPPPDPSPDPSPDPPLEIRTHWLFENLPKWNGSIYNAGAFSSMETDAAEFTLEAIHAATAETPAGQYTSVPVVTGADGTPSTAIILASADLREDYKPGYGTIVYFVRNGAVFNAASNVWLDSLPYLTVKPVTINAIKQLRRRYRWTPDVEGVSGWINIGSVPPSVIAMTAHRGRLYIVVPSAESSDRKWEVLTRPPIGLEWRRANRPLHDPIAWTRVSIPLGQHLLESATGLTSHRGELFVTTDANKIYQVFNAESSMLGPADGVSAVTASDASLFALNSAGLYHARFGSSSWRKVISVGAPAAVAMTWWGGAVYRVAQDNVVVRTNAEIISAASAWVETGTRLWHGKAMAVVDEMLFAATSEGALWWKHVNGLIPQGPLHG